MSAIIPSPTHGMRALALYNSFRTCEDKYIGSKLKNALDVIIDALRVFGANKVCCSYNGGKDAVVILYLLLAAHAHFTQSLTQESVGVTASTQPDIVYFQPTTGEFPEILEHISTIEKEFEFSLTRYDGSIMSV